MPLTNCEHAPLCSEQACYEKNKERQRRKEKEECDQSLRCNAIPNTGQIFHHKQDHVVIRAYFSQDCFLSADLTDFNLHDCKYEGGRKQVVRPDITLTSAGDAQRQEE